MKIYEFIIAAITLALIPGPDIIFVITQSINTNWKKAIYVVLGLITGLSIYTILMSQGVGALINRLPWLLSILKYIGAAYLLYIGVSGVIKARRNIQNKATEEVTDEKSRDLYIRGVIMNLINPKVMIFFLALFTPFMSDNPDNAKNEMLILGAIMIGITFVVFSVAAIIGSKIGGLLNSASQNKMTIPVISLIIYIMIAGMIII